MYISDTQNYKEAITTTALYATMRRRGRPKKIRQEKDTGTPETAFKCQNGETAEILDTLLKKDIISDIQHRCGIRLRWLHTLRYGVTDVRAFAIRFINDTESEKNPDFYDPIWREEREEEYNNAINSLNKHRCAAIVVNICIYNQKPSFLSKTIKNLNDAQINMETITKFRNGLDILAELWKK